MRISHGHHGSKRHELAQHAHPRESHTSTHTFTSAQFATTLCEAPEQLLHNLECNVGVDVCVYGHTSRLQWS